MFDLLRFCQTYRVPVLQGGHHHAHAGWVQIHCPWCAGGRGGWHLGFSLEGGNFNCWRCGPHKLYDVVGRLLRTSDEETIRQAVRNHQKEGQRPERKIITRKRDIAPPPNMGPLAPQHIKYLRSRNFDPDKLTKLWDLTGTQHLSGEWSWRVIIPVKTASGQVIAYQGRSISPTAKPKYKMSRDEDILEEPQGLLYGLQWATGDDIIIVEGATGVWRLGPGTLATFGIDWKLPQANKLRKYKRRFILFDPEPQAQKRAQELAEWLSYFPGTTEILTGFDTDPGDFTEKQAEEIRQELKLSPGPGLVER